MSTSTSTMIFVTGFFLLMFLGHSKSASNRRCLPVYDGGSYCFTQPDPPVALSWLDAMKWCRSINATLPITDSDYHTGVYKNALSYFGLQAETLWLGAKFTYDPNNWLWTDGTPFQGSIEESNSTNATHAYVMRNGSQLQFFAASPRDLKGYICAIDYSELSCASSDASFWANGRCFYKYIDYYNYYDYSWNSFRSNCQQYKIPTYDDLRELTRWLSNGQQYWIAVRCGFWEWKNLVTGRSFEFPGSGMPSAAYGQCMASNRTTLYGSSTCSRNLQFICFEHVNAKLFETKSTVSYEETTAVTTETYMFNEGSYRDPRERDYPLVIGLSVGGGILLLAVILCLAVRACRKNRAGNYPSVDPRKQSEYSHPKTTSSNAFDNYTFNAASETADKSGTRIQYKPMNPAANDYVY